MVVVLLLSPPNCLWAQGLTPSPISTGKLQNQESRILSFSGFSFWYIVHYIWNMDSCNCAYDQKALPWTHTHTHTHNTHTVGSLVETNFHRLCCELQRHISEKSLEIRTVISSLWYMLHLSLHSYFLCNNHVHITSGRM